MCHCDACMNSDDECTDGGEEVEIHHLCEECFQESEEQRKKDDIKFRQDLLKALRTSKPLVFDAKRVTTEDLIERYMQLASVVRTARVALQADIKRLQGG